MTTMQVLFLIFAAIILGSAFKVVTTKKMIHAAFWLIVALFGIAALYAMLNAGFMAMVQVVVYVGAIAILFIFAVMLTRKDLRDSAKPLNASHNPSVRHSTSQRCIENFVTPSISDLLKYRSMSSLDR